MIKRRPIFTVLSLVIAVVFALGSWPILIHSIDQQLADANLNSADIAESSRMAEFALIAGQLACGAVGAAVGAILAGIGFWRRERWQAVRWYSLILNLVAAGVVGISLFPLWRSQHSQRAIGQKKGAARAADESDARWLPKAQQADLSPLHKSAYGQIALLRICRANGNDMMRIKAGSESPSETLYKMGIDVLPILVEALDDATLTTVVVPDHRHGRGSKTWKVNELVALLIVRVAQHDFVIGESPGERVLCRPTEELPELVPQFKKLILAWYAQNQNRTLEERKIADVSDDWFRNRLDAVEWLGKNKVLSASPAIVQYINKTFKIKSKSSLHHAELAESALALGQIGDNSSLPVVRRVCQYLADGFKHHGGTGSMDVYTLFQAHQGRSLLGDKAEVLQELKSLYGQCSERLEPSTRKEYQERIETAANW